ncbi:hypothetical protein ACK1U3_21575 [Pseudomonas promysalinigenes]|uniref:hypothetical protein n=1 Tax=Pseudomonas promysalinigenes TaxID=485898 RepID=UPI0039170089
MNFDLMKATFGEERARVLSEVASLYIFNPNTFAVTVGTSKLALEDEDLDVVVYCTDPAKPSSEKALMAAPAGSLSAGQMPQVFNDTCERWLAPSLGVHVDILRRCPLWFSYSIDKLLKYNQIQAGYSTCLLHELETAIPIYDRAGWFAALRDNRLQSFGYPTALKLAVIHKNYTLLNTGKSSWLNKAEISFGKGDILAVFKYCSRFLASYLDILFALNDQYHPGEKHLMDHAMLLPNKPADLRFLVRAFLMSQHGDISNIAVAARALIASLGALIDLDLKAGPLS